MCAASPAGFMCRAPMAMPVTAATSAKWHGITSGAWERAARAEAWLQATTERQAIAAGLDAGQAVKVVSPRLRQRVLFEHVKAKPFGRCATLTRSPPRYATNPISR